MQTNELNRFRAIHKIESEYLSNLSEKLIQSTYVIGKTNALRKIEIVFLLFPL
jgi:hypothetical protein